MIYCDKSMKDPEENIILLNEWMNLSNSTISGVKYMFSLRKPLHVVWPMYSEGSCVFRTLKTNSRLFPVYFS